MDKKVESEKELNHKEPCGWCGCPHQGCCYRCSEDKGRAREKPARMIFAQVHNAKTNSLNVVFLGARKEYIKDSNQEQTETEYYEKCPVIFNGRSAEGISDAVTAVLTKTLNAAVNAANESAECHFGPIVIDYLEER